MRKRLLCLILAVAMLLCTMAGCSAATSTSSAAPKGGTLYITVNPVIAITYDASGSVVSVTAVSKDAEAIVNEYRDYVGKECTQVVTTIVEKIGNAGYLDKAVDIQITFEDDSGLPEADFTEKLVQEIETTVQKNDFKGTVKLEPPVITTPSSDTNDSGSEGSTDSKPNDSGSEGSTESKPNDSGSEGSTESKPNNSGSEGSTESKPNNSGNEGSTESKPNGSGNEGSTESKPNDSGNEGSTESKPNDSGNEGSTESQPNDSGNEGSTESQPNGSGNEGSTESQPNDSGNEGATSSMPEDAEQQGDGTYTHTEMLDLYEQVVTDAAKASFIRTTTYAANGKILRVEQTYADSGTKQMLALYNNDGIITTMTSWYRSGAESMIQYFHANGNLKNYKRFYESGAVEAEFVSFHDRNNDNGTMTQYYENGDLWMRSVMNNPDGSPNTDEMWLEDGSYSKTVMIFMGPDADELYRVGESMSKLPDGTEIREIYDYDAGTLRVIRTAANGSSDITTPLDDPEQFLAGYFETKEKNHFHRVEYRQGHKYYEITDGGTVGPQGYKVRDTVQYYEGSDQVKWTERYFYADKGRIYREFDKNGNETRYECTTKIEF